VSDAAITDKGALACKVTLDATIKEYNVAVQQADAYGANRTISGFAVSATFDRLLSQLATCFTQSNLRDAAVAALAIRVFTFLRANVIDKIMIKNGQATKESFQLSSAAADIAVKWESPMIATLVKHHKTIVTCARTATLVGLKTGNDELCVYRCITYAATFTPPNTFAAAMRAAEFQTFHLDEYKRQVAESNRNGRHERHSYNVKRPLIMRSLRDYAPFVEANYCAAMVRDDTNFLKLFADALLFEHAEALPMAKWLRDNAATIVPAVVELLKPSSDTAQKQKPTVGPLMVAMKLSFDDDLRAAFVAAGCTSFSR
jgi:hypothetical protein